MKRSIELKMRTKIIAGFSTVILIMIIIGTVALVQFGAASRGFTNYRHLARDTNLAGRLQANMLMMRLDVKDYIINGRDTDIEEYENYLNLMNGFLNEAKEEIQNTERAALISRIDSQVLRYSESFVEIQALMNQRNRHVFDNLNIIGPRMEENLSEILASTMNNNSEASFYASLSMKHLLIARLYVAKFLDDNESEFADRTREEFDLLNDTLNELDERLKNSRNLAYLDDIRDDKKEYIEHFEGVVKTILDRNEIIENKLDIWGHQIADWVEEVNLSIKAEQDALGPKLQKANRRALILIVVFLLLAMISGVSIAAYTITSVLTQLGVDPAVLEDISGKIALGDLRIDKSMESDDNSGVYKSMVDMKRKLSEIVTNVLSGIEQIAISSEELATSNQDLSNRPEQQASALQETSAAIEEMNSSVKSNADNTKTADQLSREAAIKTEEGSLSVDAMITSMNEINNSSARIAEIIEVINNISFQTNLLALNASIEAARAGEQGKGFAVVAVEVRKLAKRSDRAAGEIAEIIKNSNKKVEEGVSIANRAGEMLADINDSVKKVTTIVAEISAASQEQMASVDQIDSTLSNLDENTQRNASMVEEAASATEELSAQAQELNSNMQFFTINREKISNVKKHTPIHAIESRHHSKLNNTQTKKEESSTNKYSEKIEDNYETFSDLAESGEFDKF